MKRFPNILIFAFGIILVIIAEFAHPERLTHAIPLFGWGFTALGGFYSLMPRGQKQAKIFRIVVGIFGVGFALWSVFISVNFYTYAAACVLVFLSIWPRAGSPEAAH